MEIIALFDGIFATKPRDEWIRILRAGGDFIFTQVNSVDELPDDPQVVANRYIVDFDHPAHGKTKVVGIPVGLSETPGAVRRPAPDPKRNRRAVQPTQQRRRKVDKARPLYKDIPPRHHERRRAGCVDARTMLGWPRHALEHHDKNLAIGTLERS